MKEVLGAALATVLLLVGCAVYQPAPQWGETDNYQEVLESAWNDACELSSYSCWNLDAPDVVKTGLAPPGVAGFYYTGDDRVYIAKGADPVNVFRNYGTIVHEMVHYIQDVRHDWPDAGKSIACLREEEAWDVFNKLAIKYDQEQWVDESWPRRYGC